MKHIHQIDLHEPERRAARNDPLDQKKRCQSPVLYAETEAVARCVNRVSTYVGPDHECSGENCKAGVDLAGIVYRKNIDFPLQKAKNSQRKPLAPLSRMKTIS